MEKIDLKKSLADLYRASVRKPSFVEVPPLNYLVIDGRGDPAGKAFQEAVEALYTVAYLLKFAVRTAREIDYAVMPLEVSWRIGRGAKENIAWTAMIMQPPMIDDELFQSAVREVKLRKNAPRVDDLKLKRTEEGISVQMLHVGPYDGMNRTLETMLAHVEENAYRSGHETHDIYLNSVKKTRPENLKTIMRLPVWKG